MKEISFDPRAKMLIMILGIICVTFLPSLSYECILVAAIVIFGIVCKKIKFSLVCGGIFAGLFIYVTYGLNPDSGTVMTMFIAWLSLIFKLYPCCMLSGLIIATTKINEFMSAMNKAHIPGKIVIPLAVMLRYFPTIHEDWNYIKDAMKLRGVAPGIKNLVIRPVQVVNCLYVPLLISASKAADELAVASVTRGIENPKPRTCVVRIGFKIWDYAAVIFFVLITMGSFVY